MKHRRDVTWLGALACLAALAAACGRTQHPGNEQTSPGAATASGGATELGGAAAGGAPCCSGAGCVCEEEPPSTHGVVPMHRLRGVEYENSINDLFGMQVDAPVVDQERPFEAVIDDAKPWLQAATTVAHETLQRADLPQPLACIKSSPDAACAQLVIDELGLRAFRRPLLQTERQAFTALYDDVAARNDAQTALEDVLRALLLSPAFLFHVELSDDPDGSAPEPLDSYALAARLSFALWSTTPDQSLLDAASADLTGDAALGAAFERLTLNERALELPDGWSEVWLGVTELNEQVVDFGTFSTFTEGLRQAMLTEQQEVLRRFWRQSVALRELPTLDLNFVDASLAAHYGFSPGVTGFVNDPDDARAGLLGQGAILTLTSLERRVSATKRGRFVLERLLCRPLPAVPPGEAGSLGAQFSPGTSERETLEQQVSRPVCQGCHGLLDPLGLALSEFDGVGAYRTQDSQGQPIDARVQLPEPLFPGGPGVSGARELGAALGENAVFQRCVAQQLASYLIQRDLSEKTDADLLEPLGQAIAEQASLPELTRRIVMSDHFRHRRMAQNPRR